MVVTGDHIFLFFTLLIVVTGGMMAALIGFVLPECWLFNEDEVETPATHSGNKISTWIKELHESRSYDSIEKYKWLVSISFRLHYVEELYEYACSGVIVGKDEILTGEACIKNSSSFTRFSSLSIFSKEDFLHAVVRSNSEYHSYGGQTHSVLTYSFYKDKFVSLKVMPHFKSDMIIKSATDINDFEFEAVGWGGLRVMGENLLKFQKFHITNWIERSKGPKNLQKCYNFSSEPEKSKEIECVRIGYIGNNKPDSCGGLNGRVLVTKKDHIYVGMECDGLPVMNYTENDIVMFQTPKTLKIEQDLTPQESQQIQTQETYLNTKQKVNIYFHEARLFDPAYDAKRRGS